MKKQINIKLPQYGGEELVAYGNSDAIMDVSLSNVSEMMYKVMTSSMKSTPLTLTMFKRFILTIQLMNEFPEDNTILLGVPASKWEIPTLFANLVQPSSVKVVNEIRFPNLIDTDVRYMSDEDMESLVALDFVQFNGVISMIESLIYGKKLTTQTLPSLRAPKRLSDVLDNLVEDGKVHFNLSEEKPFYFIRGGLSIWAKSELTIGVADYIMSRFTYKWNTLLRGTIEDETTVGAVSK